MKYLIPLVIWLMVFLFGVLLVNAARNSPPRPVRDDGIRHGYMIKQNVRGEDMHTYHFYTFSQKDCNETWAIFLTEHPEYLEEVAEHGIDALAGLEGLICVEVVMEEQ